MAVRWLAVGIAVVVIIAVIGPPLDVSPSDIQNADIELQNGDGGAQDPSTGTPSSTPTAEQRDSPTETQTPPSHATQSSPVQPSTEGDPPTQSPTEDPGSTPSQTQISPTPTPSVGQQPNQSGLKVVTEDDIADLPNQTQVLEKLEFITQLHQNDTLGNQTISGAATEICELHDQKVPNVTEKATNISEEAYRNTYRVGHSAKVLSSHLGAHIDIEAIQSRMGTARSATDTAARYAPVFGSYERLHNASCGVKAGEQGSQEDFLVSLSAFTADVILVKENIAYRASFSATRYVSQEVGMMRLANICGYKCVGLVQSEIHWAIRGTVHGGVSFIADEAMNGTVSIGEWNATVQEDVNNYLDNTTDSVIVGGAVATAGEVKDCVVSEIDPGDIVGNLGQFGEETISGLQTVIDTQELPDDIQLAKLTEIEDVRECVGDSDE